MRFHITSVVLVCLVGGCEQPPADVTVEAECGFFAWYSTCDAEIDDPEQQWLAEFDIPQELVLNRICISGPGTIMFQAFVNDEIYVLGTTTAEACYEQRRSVHRDDHILIVAASDMAGELFITLQADRFWEPQTTTHSIGTQARKRRPGYRRRL